jgi:hypothetical protein
VLARAGDFSHGRRGHGVRYSGTIIKAHHLSQALAQSPCLYHVSPRAEQLANLTPSRCQRLSQGAGAHRRLFARPAWPRRKLLWHDYQRALRACAAGRASAWAPRLSTRNAQRRNCQSTVRRTTSGAAGNGLGSSIKYLRRTTNGAAGKGLSRC